MHPRLSMARLWPRRLQHQLLLVLTMVTLLSAALQHRMSVLQVDAEARAAAARQAQRVADAAAAALATEFVGPPGSPEPAVLRAVGALPGLHSLVVLERDGQPLRRFVAEGNGLVEAAPDAAAPEGDDLAIASAAIGSLTRVQVAISRQLELEALARHRDRTFVTVMVLLVLTIAVVYAWQQRALAALPRLAAFAEALGAGGGERLQVRTSCHELDALAGALDRTSQALHGQMEALRQAEQRTAAIVNATPDALLGLDGEGCVALANPAVASIFGLEPEQAVGVPLSTLLEGLDSAEIERRTEQGLYMRSSHTRIARFELDARRRDGTEFPAEVSLSRVDTPDGARYACVVRDVTEQRMTFSMLNLYSRALECATNGVVISDMSLPGHPVFYANPAFYRITGYDIGEAIGRNCKFLQREDTAQPELEVVRRAIAAGESATVVLRNYRKDGTLFFNELAIAPVTAPDGRIQHYVGIVNDVTERERARMAIAERSARLNAVFDLSPDGFVVFDRDGRCAYGNRAFETMTGWESGFAQRGMTLAEFDGRMRAMRDPAHAYPELSSEHPGDDSFECIDLLYLAQPRRRVLTRLVRHNAGGQGESILYFRDVTHETEIDRMKSEFLTTAAHELRTPMVSVYGFTELLLHRPVPEGRRRDVLETIHRQASLLINMVNELLDLARIEARQGKDMKRSPCRLGDLVDQAVSALMVHGDDRRVAIDCPHADTTLDVDPEKVHRALTNVLSNAYKYSPGGGTIALRTLAGEIDGLPALGVRVTDQGIGMTPEQSRRVFERFFRADPSGNIPGTGLGMSLVKEIVELHGGRVELQSEAGVGTEVTLWLPLDAARAVARVQALPQHLTQDA
ncbi:MAG: PAS domain S-box protein [Rubrivivax sp.]